MKMREVLELKAGDMLHNPSNSDVFYITRVYSHLESFRGAIFSNIGMPKKYRFVDVTFAEAHGMTKMDRGERKSNDEKILPNIRRDCEMFLETYNDGKSRETFQTHSND